jgi:hypothetical protein
MKRALYKRMDELAAWDLDAGCRRIVNQQSPGNRRLKKVLNRQARAKLNREFTKEIKKAY